MGKPNFSDEFKRDAVAQITERGYPVAEVSERRGEEVLPEVFQKLFTGNESRDQKHMS